MLTKAQQLAIIIKLCIEFSRTTNKENFTEPELLEEFKRYVNDEISVNDIMNWAVQTTKL